MLREFIKSIRKTQFIIICITSMMILILILSSYIDNVRLSIAEADNQRSSNYLNFNFSEGIEAKTIKSVINSLMTTNKIIIWHQLGVGFEPGTDSIGVYLNNDKINGYSLLEGRLFNKSDFNNSNRVALVGKNVLNLTKLKSGKRYILSGTDEYEVIGVLGKKNISTRYDDQVVYNLNSELTYNEQILEDGWTIDSSSKTEGQLRQLLDNINSQYKKNVVMMQTKESQPNPIAESIQESGFVILNVVLLVFCIFISLVKSIMFWIDNIKVEIGIRKAVGASNRNLYLYITEKYIIISVISFIIAIIIEKLLLISKLVTINNYKLSYSSVIISIIFAFIIGVIFIQLTMKQIIKMDTSKLLKGIKL